MADDLLHNQIARSGFSVSQVLKDIAILVFVLLPEGAHRILGIYSDKPIAIWLEERGIPVTWLFLITIPLGLIMFFKQHRVRAKKEAAFLADQFPKQAPLLLFLFIGAFLFFFLRACNLNHEKDNLAGMLTLATNPP